MSGASEKDTCLLAVGEENPEVLVVTKYPPTAFSKKSLNAYLDEAGVPSSRAFTGAVKCSNADREPTTKDVRECAEYLHREIEVLNPRGVLLVGQEPLIAVLGKTGIMKYRARVEEREGRVFFPTISPAMVTRNPGLREGFLADLRYFTRAINDEKPPLTLPERMRMVMTAGGVEALREALTAAEVVVYDIESNQFDEFRPDSVIASIAFTLQTGDQVEVWTLPLGHPESPFLDQWQTVFKRACEPLVTGPRKKVVAHNGKFDGRWLHQFGVPIQLTFDTMLAAHLLNENGPKGLKPLAQSLLGAVPWDIDASLCMSKPLREVLKYNGADTWYTYHLYLRFRQNLLDQPRLGQIMAKLMVPASNIFTEIEREGIWVDRERLSTRAKIVRDELRTIDEKLMGYVPPIEEWPEKLQARGPNFGPSDFQKWFLFEHLGYPILERTGKGAPSTAEGVMLKLIAEYPDDEVPKLLVERAKWQKYSSSFFSAYEELVDERDHIHTTFKLHGTVTGRLSSGKGDSDKVTGRVTNRGVNLQQVPRDKFVRGIFGAPPGWLFMECDYSQIELRVAAFLAQETTMLHLYNTGQDIHTATARTMTGKSTPTSEERKKAKAVNFGFLYGMGAPKFIETAWNNYGVVVSEGESKAFRAAFFDQFDKLPAWHNKQRHLALKYKRVESPLGRVRHLPDIESKDEGVRAEAQRQAINSPVQSFASDMCVLSLVLLSRRFKALGLRARSVGTIHDAINMVVPVEEADVVIPLVREVMENLPLEKLFNVHLNVPIVADVKLGRYWGDTVEVDNSISENPEKLRAFIQEHLSDLGL